MITTVRTAIGVVPTRRLLSQSAIVCGVYLLGLAGAELLLVTSGLVAGAVSHSILIAVLLTHALAASQAPYRRLLIVLVLPSLIRVLGLTVPVAATPSAIWYLMAGTPALLGVVLAARIVGLPPRLFAWPAKPWVQLVIAASGVTAGLLAYLVARPPALSGDPVILTISAASVAVFAAGTEELLFRGTLQSVVTDLFESPIAGIAVSTAAFGLMYAGSLSATFVLLMISVGLLLGWAVQRTGSLWGAMAAHAAFVVGLVVVWPLVLR